MKNTPQLQHLAALVARADSCLVAITSGRGRDGHGERLPDLDANLAGALASLVEAGHIAAALLKASPQPQTESPPS